MNYNFKGCDKHTSAEIIAWIDSSVDYGIDIPDEFWEDMKAQKDSLDNDLLEMLYIYFPNEKQEKQEDLSTKPTLMSMDEINALGVAMAKDQMFSNRFIENELFENVPLALLDEYHDNIFTPQDDETYESLVESIRLNGVREPILVLKKSDERYEILAGHNRTRACRDLGYKDIKAIIFTDLSEEEAKGIYFESNLIRKDKSQRLPSELAKVYSEYSNLKNVLGKRYDEIRGFLKDNALADGIRITDRDILAYELGISSRSIAEYIRLNNLEKHLLQKVDDNKIGLKVGVELSFLGNTQQVWVNEILDEYEKTKISFRIAKALRGLDPNATYEDYKKVILGKEIIEEDKEKPKEKKWVVKLNEDFLSNFFDEEEDEKVIKDIIREALKNHFRKNQ